MFSLTRVYMLYVVDTIPTLLLDEIRHCPLLYYCVTDITQNSHMILYQVVGRAKKKKIEVGFI